MKAAIVVAVEHCADLSLGTAPYASVDASAFANALRQHGLESAHCEVLTDSQATKTSIESSLRITLRNLQQNDTLLLYWTGPVITTECGEAYFTCFDTRPADREDTSVSLRWLLDQQQRSSCGRMAWFLDPRQAIAPVGGFDPAFLGTIFMAQPHGACFVACQPHQQSHVSHDLKRGIWSHHLTQAFSGDLAAALTGNQLTAASLQAHLESAVPLTLRTVHPLALQSPALFSAAGDIVLAEFQDPLAKRKKAKDQRLGQVKDSILLAESVASIKSLSGFQKSKGHNVPDRQNASARTFIGELADSDLKEDVQRIRTALKAEFKFTRTQLSANVIDGGATITTPYFNYNVSVGQSSACAGDIVWRRSVDAIIDPEKVLSQKFERVFAGVFDTFELTLHETLDLEQLIDQIEALASDTVRVEYTEDEAITNCTVRLKRHRAAIRVTPQTLSIVYPRATSPQLLIKSFFEMQGELSEKHQVLVIPYEDAAPS